MPPSTSKTLHIGTSGWYYPHWKHIFYPDWLRSADYLQYYAQHFSTTEINTSFYGIPQLKTIDKWLSATPASFLFCPKMYKGITHDNRLLRPEESLPPFLEILAPLNGRLGPVLIQLPPSLSFEEEAAHRFFSTLRSLAPDTEFALEPRHASWLLSPAHSLLQQYKIGWVIADSGGKWPSVETTTNSTVYLRMHGPDGSYASSYLDAQLQSILQLCQPWRLSGKKVWIFFNNDYMGYAIKNSQSLMAMGGVPASRRSKIQLGLF